MPQQLQMTTAVGPIVLDYRKAAFLPDHDTLLVADLHFEKGSYLQANGHAPIPTYDTPDTIARLREVVAYYKTQRVIALGDSFHDPKAELRLSKSDFDQINDVIDMVSDFTWILGNHDPDIPQGLSGGQEDHVSLGGFLLTHYPVEGGESFNICGHLHPKLRVKTRHRNFWKACFACGDQRMILPSFGTFTGGLDVKDPAIAGALSGEVWYGVTGEREVIAIADQGS